MLSTIFRNPKNWFKVGEQEYSTNLRFFKENQISYSKSGDMISFFSRLEKKLFKEINIQDHRNELADNDLDKIIQEIHNDLLMGKFGKGIYIN